MTTAAIIDGILDREGGFANHPADRGGPTNWGITKATLAARRGRPVTTAEVQRLSRSEAGFIYRRRYIEVYGFDRIEYSPLQVLVIDYHVNSGIDNVARAIQTITQTYPIDGIFGPRTRRALADADPVWMFRQLLIYRVREHIYESLGDPETIQFIHDHPKLQINNLRGWVARDLSLLPGEVPLADRTF